jgi:Peroxiredoxin
MPFPFSSVCDKEICELRVFLDSFYSAGTDTVMITVSARPPPEAWAIHHGVDFPFLADFWPHGAVSLPFGCFDDVAGISFRYTYITDGHYVITAIIYRVQIGVGRDFADYRVGFSISLPTSLISVSCFL